MYPPLFPAVSVPLPRLAQGLSHVACVWPDTAETMAQRQAKLPSARPPVEVRHVHNLLNPGACHIRQG